MPEIIIKPQDGFQLNFTSNSADIVIGGSGAGVGKTFALLLEAMRFSKVEGFVGVLFRRTSTDIRTGGLWDAAKKVYMPLGAKFNENELTVTFPVSYKKSGTPNFTQRSAYLKFSHLQYDKDAFNWQGKELAFIGFDELTHFSYLQYSYLISRLRSTCGVKPYLRATCNPDADSFVADMISWYLNEDGNPIAERNGVLRYYVVDNDNYVWGNSKKEVLQKIPHITDKYAGRSFDVENLVKSFSFVKGSIFDNQKLLSVSPEYLGNLEIQSEAEKRKLIDGNWKAMLSGFNLAKHVKVLDFLHSSHNPQINKINEVGGGYLYAAKDKYITCDHARAGRDLCVIVTWLDLHIDRINVLTKSDSNQIVEVIRGEMIRANVGVNNVIVDADGVGVIDILKCKTFIPNASPIKVKHGGKDVPQNYENLKTQLAYIFCEKYINENLVSMGDNCYFVHGANTDSVTINSKSYNIEKLIEKQILSVRMDKPDSDGKRKILRKDAQKNLLNGMSPDFYDAIVMRIYFELQPKFSGSFFL